MLHRYLIDDGQVKSWTGDVRCWGLTGEDDGGGAAHGAEERRIDGTQFGGHC